MSRWVCHPQATFTILARLQRRRCVSTWSTSPARDQLKGDLRVVPGIFGPGETQQAGRLANVMRPSLMCPASECLNRSGVGSVRGGKVGVAEIQVDLPARAKPRPAGSEPLSPQFRIREVSLDALDRSGQHALKADRAGFCGDVEITHRAFLLPFQTGSAHVPGHRAVRSRNPRRSGSTHGRRPRHRD